MTITSRTYLAFCLLLFAAPPLAPAEPESKPSGNPEIAALLRQLGHPEFKKRDEAQKKLLSHPEARSIIQAHAKKGESEAHVRAARIVQLMDWGIRAETPSDVLNMIELFRAPPRMIVDDYNESPEDAIDMARLAQRSADDVFPELLDLCAKSGDERALYLAITSRSKEDNEGFVDMFIEHTRDRAVEKIRKGELDETLALYDRVLQISPAKIGQNTYAGIVLALGKEDEATRLWKKRAEGTGFSADCARAVLLQIYIAHEKLDRAIEIARASKQRIFPLLIDACHWKELPEELGKARFKSGEPDGTPGLRILAYEFAGDAANVTSAARQATKQQRVETSNPIVHALLISGKIDEAVAVARNDRNFITQLMVLEKAGRYKAAMVVATREGRNFDIPTEWHQARLDYRQGNKAQALAQLAELSKRPDEDLAYFQTLLEIGETEIADGAMAGALDNAGNDFTTKLRQYLGVEFDQENSIPDTPSLQYYEAIFRAIVKLNPDKKNAPYIAMFRQFLAHKLTPAQEAAIRTEAARIVDLQYHLFIESEETLELYYEDSAKLNLFEELGETQRAEPIYKRMCEDKETSAYHFSTYAEILKNRNDLENAERVLRKGMEHEGSRSPLAYQLSCVLKMRNRAAEADEWLKRAKAMAAGDVYETTSLAQTMSKNGDTQNALEQARLAMHFHEDDYGIRLYTPFRLAPIFEKAPPAQRVQFWQKVAMRYAMINDIVHTNSSFADLIRIRTSLAEAYLAADDKPAAIASLEIVAKFSPEDKAVADRIASLREAK